MAGALTDYARNKISDALMRGVSITFPTQWWIALFSVAPTNAGGGTEFSGGAYARQQLNPSTTNWSATNAPGSTVNPSTGTTGTSSNNVTITFPAATTNEGTAVDVAFFDASTGGNMWIYGALTTNQVVNVGGTLSFAPGTLSNQLGS